MSNTAKRVKVLSDSYVQQINILKVMSREAVSREAVSREAVSREAVSREAVATRTGREFHINEIATQSGLNDERETQRCLYILEGQKLVTPLPPGDFTSKTWQITKDGLRALNTISRSAIQ
jgi:hypothetical protein